MNMVYRAYRIPYHWIPQLEKPQENSIEPLDLRTFRVPGAAMSGIVDETEVEGVIVSSSRSEEELFCVISDADSKI